MTTQRAVDRDQTEAPVLTAQNRNITGKKVKQLRAGGWVPAIVYGRGVPSTPLQLNGRELREVLTRHGASSLLYLRIEGSEPGLRPVLLQHVERHPVSGVLLHIDFHQVEPNRPVRTTVPVIAIGDAPATRAGHVVVFVHDAVEVKCLPRDLPSQLKLDVAGLAEPGDALYVNDLRPPPGVSVLTDPDKLLFHVIVSKAQLELEAEAAAAEAEAPAAADESKRGGSTTPGM